jgi:hypothetical protein
MGSGLSHAGATLDDESARASDGRMSERSERINLTGLSPRSGDMLMASPPEAAIS